MNARPRKSPFAGVLPAKLLELVEAVGFPETLKLVERWGGVRLYVPLPEHVTPEHPIAKEIGLDAALKLAATIRKSGSIDQWLEVPRAARYLRKVRDQLIRSAYTETSASRLARKHGMTRRNIFYIVGREDADEPQRDLFDVE